MIVRAGFQIIDFQRDFDLPKPITFASQDDALKLLKQTGFLDSQTILGVRECLRRFADDPDCGQWTDHEALERMAGLLYSGKVVAVARQQEGGTGTPTSKAPTTTVAFPLSERSQRTAPAATSKPAPAEDPATFSPKLDSVVQAAALVTAADAGKPFCPQ